jgi:hypothetical protein
MGTLSVVLPAANDEVLGVLTGLPAAPLKVIAQAIYEDGVVVQSGLVYDFTPYKLNVDGFNWKLKVVDNEYWPGPGPVTLTVDYAWSAT